MRRTIVSLNYNAEWAKCSVGTRAAEEVGSPERCLASAIKKLTPRKPDVTLQIRGGAFLLSNVAQKG